jgi:hypothetical protein
VLNRAENCAIGQNTAVLRDLLPWPQARDKPASERLGVRWFEVPEREMSVAVRSIGSFITLPKKAQLTMVA